MPVLIKRTIYVLMIILLVIHANEITGHYGLVPGIITCFPISGIIMFLLLFWTPKKLYPIYL